MAKQTLASVLTFISTASREQLRQLNEEIHNSYRTLDAAAANSFKVGQKVEFDTRKRGYARTIRGTVTALNYRSVTVMVNDGGFGRNGQWRVSPGLLRKAGK